MNRVIQLLRTAVCEHAAGTSTDGQLLERFVSRREAAALEVLVRRHGPMVWAVCRRLLHDHHDAEDAFQATFLVLVRKAASVVPRALVGNWLYGVAHQTALKARATTAKRRTRERQVTAMPQPVETESDLWHDVQPVLDQELSRLPDKYRVAIVLCNLEGKTRKEAARQLGCPEGTLAARLARGRVMLARRLRRHGLAVSGGALAGLLSLQAASAGVPPSVVSSTIKAVTLVAAGQAAVAGAISAKAVAITEGVLKIMLLNKIKVATATLLAIAVLGAGMVGLTRPIEAIAQAETPKQDARSCLRRPVDAEVLASQAAGAIGRPINPSSQGVAVIVARATDDAGVARVVPMKPFEVSAVEGENAAAVRSGALQNAGVVAAPFARFLNG